MRWIGIGGDRRHAQCRRRPPRSRRDRGQIGIAAPWADSESSEPLAFIAVKDRSVATSGNSQRGFRSVAGDIAHLRPRSSSPVDRIVAATVIAERSVDAGAFAKVCNVLDPEESVRIAGSLPGVECLIITKDGRTTRSDGGDATSSSACMASLADNPKPADPESRSGTSDKLKAEAKGKASTPWNKEFEVVVNLEINHPDAQAGRCRRPYVAVWVEDKDGNSVRHLHCGSRWAARGRFSGCPT